MNPSIAPDPCLQFLKAQLQTFGNDKMDAYLPLKGNERTEMIQLFSDYKAELERLLMLPESDLHATVMIGSTITLTYLHYQTTDSFKLVLPEEASTDEGRISFLSPAGRRLLLAKKGDIIVIPTASESLEVRVDDIQLQLDWPIPVAN